MIDVIGFVLLFFYQLFLLWSYSFTFSDWFYAKVGTSTLLIHLQIGKSFGDFVTFYPLRLLLVLHHIFTISISVFSLCYPQTIAATSFCYFISEFGSLGYIAHLCFPSRRTLHNYIFLMTLSNTIFGLLLIQVYEFDLPKLFCHVIVCLSVLLIIGRQKEVYKRTCMFKLTGSSKRV
eukprot:UN24004